MAKLLPGTYEFAKAPTPSNPPLTALIIPGFITSFNAVFPRLTTSLFASFNSFCPLFLASDLASLINLLPTFLPALFKVRANPRNFPPVCSAMKSAALPSNSFSFSFTKLFPCFNKFFFLEFNSDFPFSNNFNPSRRAISFASFTSLLPTVFPALFKVRANPRNFPPVCSAMKSAALPSNSFSFSFTKLFPCFNKFFFLEFNSDFPFSNNFNPSRRAISFASFTSLLPTVFPALFKVRANPRNFPPSTDSTGS